VLKVSHNVVDGGIWRKAKNSPHKHAIAALWCCHTEVVLRSTTPFHHGCHLITLISHYLKICLQEGDTPHQAGFVCLS